MIRWFAKNDLAANFLMIGILVAGVIVALTEIPLEVRPTRELSVIHMTFPFRGASPQEVERQVLVPVEQRLQNITGVKELHARAFNGMGKVSLFLKDGVDPKEKLPEVERLVRSTRSLPAGLDTIKYDIPDTSRYFEVISVAVQGTSKNTSLLDLTEHAFRVRDRLLSLPEVSQASVVGTSPQQFSIQLDQEKLFSYGLTIDKVQSSIKNNSQESGAGTIQYEGGRLALKPGKAALTGEAFANLPISLPNGESIPLSHLATIKDGYPEELKEVSYDGYPALIIEIFQSREQSAITVANAVKDFVAQSQQDTTDKAFLLHIWDDESYRIEGRLTTLAESLFQGGLLVIIILGLFLRPSLAFWVAVGIPISFAGGAIFMPIFGLTGNIMSIFAFILVLGIVVDDAIVTAENIYEHKRMGKSGLDAAVIGTQEVSTPVIFGVLTTIVAFLPLYNFDGYWGVMAAQIPPVVIAVLLFSLIESKLILPNHLKHLNFSEKSDRYWYNRIPDWFNGKLTIFIQSWVKPAVQLCMSHRYLTLSIFTSIALATFGVWQSGRLGFQVFPAVDINQLNCRLTMPSDTVYDDTKRLVTHVYQAALQLQDEFRDGEDPDAPSIVTGIVTSAGGYYARGYNEHVGQIVLDLMPPEKRSHNMVDNTTLVNRMRELCGEMPDAQSFYIRAQMAARKNAEDPDPIDIQIRGNITDSNKQILQELEDLIRTEIPKEDLESISSDKSNQQFQLQITLNEEGKRYGLTESLIAKQIKGSMIGTEITRIPRTTGEVRVYLGFPSDLRKDRYALDHFLVSLNNGTLLPLAEIADIEITEVPAHIFRIDGAAITKVIASPKDRNYDLVQFAETITPKINQLFDRYPELNWVFGGYLADYKEMRQKLIIGVTVLSLVIFALLALPFNSVVQPIYVMLAIPFGVIGAILGHIIMGATPSYLSMFGLLALSGVVVNDSLVLVDCVNGLRKSGIPIREALITAVTKRFRPIMLTSLTTFAGLLPLIFSQSMQSKFLVPMAISLGYGVLFATVVTLVLLPVIMLISHDIQSLFKRKERSS